MRLAVRASSGADGEAAREPGDLLKGRTPGISRMPSGQPEESRISRKRRETRFERYSIVPSCWEKGPSHNSREKEWTRWRIACAPRKG